jgi:hypothetical protein
MQLMSLVACYADFTKAAVISETSFSVAVHTKMYIYIKITAWRAFIFPKLSVSTA